jgi:hypothetical protein
MLLMHVTNQVRKGDLLPASKFPIQGRVECFLDGPPTLGRPDRSGFFRRERRSADKTHEKSGEDETTHGNLLEGSES